MSPAGLAILIGAGPATGAGIARILATQGNYAVALLSRSPDNLSALHKSLAASAPGGTFATFPTDASSPDSITKTFADIRSHSAFHGLKLKLAIYSVKHASKKPFLTETHEEFTQSMTTYVGGAMAFAQESIKMMFAQQGETALADGGAKKGTLIFTGTLGALRTNAHFSAYGATRASVRMLAQGLGKEFSEKGVQVVHAIANGGIADEEEEAQRAGKKMSAEAVGKTYLWLSEQEPCLWTSELDMRPAQEKY